jgi:hypothetical protein
MNRLRTKVLTLLHDQKWRNEMSDTIDALVGFLMILGAALVFWFITP